MTTEIDSLINKLPVAQVGRLPIREAAREALKHTARDDVFGLAAELAFRAVLALLPFLLLVAALPSVMGSILNVPDIGDQISHQADMLLSKNSAEMVHTVVGEVTKSQGWSLVIFGLTGTISAGLSATSSTRKALNRLYGFEENKPFLERKLLELTLTVIVGCLVIAALSALLMGPLLLKGFPVSPELVSALVAVLLMTAGVSLVYWLAPAQANSFRWITPGTAFFVLVWLLFSAGFSVYLSQYGTLNKVYGSLGAMLALLFWLYGSNVALLMGAELNAVLGNRLDPKVN